MRKLRSSAGILLLVLWAGSAGAEIVTYQKGDGKGVVSETDDTTIDATVPDTTWVDDGQDITHFEVDLSAHRHTILKFPNIFGNGTNQIPPGSLILSAILTLNMDNEGTDCPDAYQLNEGWTESEATWNSRRTGVSWTDSGADGTTSHKAALEGVLPCALPLGDKTVDVTTSVQNWSDGEANEGWVFVDTGGSSNGVNFRSSEHATQGDRPELSVSYLPTVFYSVGTNAGDLKTLSPTITIATGVATLDVAQTNDIGVGDVIDFDSPTTLVYIWDVISPTQFRVQTSTGTLPVDVVASVAVNSIKRAFNSVASAITDSSNGSHLGTSDLTALGRRLTWICYDDTFFDVSSTTTITGYTTDATHFITLTVAGASQVATGNSQRHRGTAGTGVRFEASSGGIDFLAVREAYTRIEWVEFDGNDISTTQGILLESGADNSHVRNVILHHLTGGTNTANGILIDLGNDSSEVQNSIVYAYDADGIHVSGTNAVIANSTFYLGRTSPASNSVQTDTGGTATVYNVLAVGPETDFWENDAPGLSLNNCISTDSSASDFDVSGSFKTGVTEFSEFISVTGTINLHLRAGAEALEFAVDLSASFIDDIDDETRPLASAWDVGADESVFTAAAPRYRSIGSAADLTNQGTVTVTVGSSTVTKTGGLGWLSENRGRGDVLIVGANEYMIEAVISDNELRLASLPATGFVGSTYTIARQHTTMRLWYDCVNNTTVCPYFPVSSASLVADDRSEVGIAYNDTPFVLSGHINMQGATTDTSHTIQLTVDRGNRHNGTPSAGVVVDANGANEIKIRDSNVTVEWLELKGCKGADFLSPIEVWSTDGDMAVNIVLQNLLIHDFDDGTFNNSGIDLTGNNTLIGKTVTIRNTMIWDGDQRGIEGDEPLDVAIIDNVSIDGMAQTGIWADSSTFTIRNTIVTSSPGADYDAASGSISGTNNTSSDTSAGTYFANFQNSVAATAVFVAPNSDLHLKAGANVAVNTGVDLVASFWNDIDNQYRPRAAPWDRGADERDATTAVALQSFTASPLNAAVELSWETASELNNLGFHVYRATTPDGDYTLVTARPIPGLGSSPVGARYTYRDRELENGVTYYYKLEDIETTGATKLHGPVSATPQSVLSPSTGAPTARIAYGEPTTNSFRILKRGPRQIVFELITEGFYAEPQEDGSVRLHVPGFESLAGEIPVKRTWVEAVVGRKVKLTSVRAQRVEAFTSLRPSNGEIPELVATRTGTVRAGRRRRAARTAFRRNAATARIVSVGFQGEQKKAMVELAPLRWDAASGQLLLARRLVVRVSFTGREPSELATGRGYKKRRSHDTRNVVAHLRTSAAGLHIVRYEDVMRSRRGVAAKTLRLSRQGKAVAYHLVPSSKRFKPGSVLYFSSEGAAANPYGSEAIYELEVGDARKTMEVVSGAPSGVAQRVYWHREEWEQNRYYQAALVDAPDLWLWDLLFAPETKSYPLEVSALAAHSAPSKFDVWLQGASDFLADPDHHVRVYVNGTLVGERRWDGKQAVHLDLELAPGILHDGANALELESVGDTGASYSMVMLDRYALEYPRIAREGEGRVEGRFREAGTAELEGFQPGTHVLDVSGAEPRWLVDTEIGPDHTLRFRVESARSYLAVNPSAVHRPRVTFPSATRLKRTRHQADYVVIGPSAFLEAATPLLNLRRGEGLHVKAVSIEDVYSEFGFGESTPEAVKDFLSYAYHNWTRPSPRYVLLLGDATYDFKNELNTGVTNHVPPRIVKTTYLWTASDPSYAAVNGEDLLPDLAIGRLPAATTEQVENLVEKSSLMRHPTERAGIVQISFSLRTTPTRRETSKRTPTHWPEACLLRQISRQSTRADSERPPLETQFCGASTTGRRW